jgi:hypothetical protein
MHARLRILGKSEMPLVDARAFINGNMSGASLSFNNAAASIPFGSCGATDAETL